MNPGTVQFMRLESNPDLPLPTRATPHAAGYDIRSAEHDFTLVSKDTDFHQMSFLLIDSEHASVLMIS